MQRRQKATQLPWLLLLAGSFLLGLLFGRSMALRVSQETLAEVESYLLDFVSLEQIPFWETVISTVVLYFRYPLIAFFMGFASIGLFFLPLTGIAFGFFLSFSVCCFTAAFGSRGVALALAVFGLRCALTIPCFFLLAVPSAESSSALAGLGHKGRRVAPVVYGRACWLRLLAVTAVLACGVLVELMIAPYLLDTILGYIFF